MSIRVRYKLLPQISSDSTEAKDLGNATIEVVSDLYSDGGSYKVVVPLLTTDQAIPLAGISNCGFLLIRTAPKDTTLTPVNVVIKKNSTSGEAITIAPFGNKEGLFVITTSGVTSLYATNASSTTDMELTIFVAGS